MAFQIITDATADLTSDLMERYGVEVVGMDISVDGVNYHTVGPQAIDARTLISEINAGKKAQTSAAATGEIQEKMESYVSLGKGIFYLAFSSGLSGTFQSASIARDLVLEKYPQANIIVVDSLAAASGEGYLLEELVKLRDAGKSLEEAEISLLGLIPRLKSWFMVDDLNFLALGGRISKTAAVFGSMVNIKPVLDVDPTGHLRAVTKVRGSKKALISLVQNTLEDLDLAFPKIIVSYSGDHSLADETVALIKESREDLTVIIRALGPVISAHTGSGTIALFSIGKSPRE